MIRHKLTLILLFFIFISSVNAQEKSAHFGMGLNFGVANIVYYHDSRDNDYSHPFFFNSGILEFIQLKQLTINLGQEIYSVTIHHEPSLKYALDDYTIFSKHLRFPIGFDFHLSEKASRTIFLRLAFIPDFVYLNEINGFFPGVDKRFRIDSYRFEVGPGIVLNLWGSLKVRYALTYSDNFVNSLRSDQISYSEINNKIGVLYSFK